MSPQEIIELRKREKALYDIALKCFAELCQPLDEKIYKARLDQAIERQVKINLDNGFTGE